MPFIKLLPNILSLSRIPLGLLVVVLYDPHSPMSFYLALGVIFLALLTDVADGKLARYLNCTSLNGYMLDGLGDKAFYVALLVVMMREHNSMSIVVWLLIVREIAMYALRVMSQGVESQLKRLRIFSLMHALWIRLFFALVLAHDFLLGQGNSMPVLLNIAMFSAGLACLSGGIGLSMQTKELLSKR